MDPGGPIKTGLRSWKWSKAGKTWHLLVDGDQGRAAGSGAPQARRTGTLAIKLRNTKPKCPLGQESNERRVSSVPFLR